MTPDRPATRWPAIAIAGPTASGKTGAALAVAAHLSDRVAVEIVSVDSALVYRGMDLGTAKPTVAERDAVPHHLIDIRDPLHPYSAAEFLRDVSQAIEDIQGRDALPLLAGGTMLYFKALFDGLSAMPAADAQVRRAIDAEAESAGWPAMHAELAKVDPVTAARLAPRDSQRIQRALEVFRSSGRPLSAWHAEPAAGRRQPLVADRMISLEPAERGWLHDRIARRFDSMLESGFLDEVRALRSRGDLRPDLPSMRCVGYRQAWEYLDASEGCIAAAAAAPAPQASKLAADLRDGGIAATRQLAKRQMTWLRSMPRRQVVRADAPDALPQVLRRAEAMLESASAFPRPDREVA
jgi:tRNA dimethylallyltransferase